MGVRSANLALAIEGLEKALKASGPDQSDRLRQALERIEAAAAEHVAALLPPDGKIVDVDRPRLPSPTVERRADKLAVELADVIREAQGLRAQLGRATNAPVGDPATLAGALPVAPEAGAAVDWGVFVQRARRLLAELEQLDNREADLIYDSVNTDIGAGD